MPAFLQPSLGSGIGITDYRSHCQQHHQLARDSNALNERDLREKMQEHPEKIRDLRLKYVPQSPYFEIDKCWTTQNPPIGFPHYNGI